MADAGSRGLRRVGLRRGEAGAWGPQLVRRTRPNGTADTDGIGEFVSWGAGPRASQCLIIGAKARAILEGRYAATIEDVKAVAVPVLRHRVVTNFNAEAQGIAPTDLIARLIG